jgi:DNA repair exonuclease SbcCD ATPase subunit
MTITLKELRAENTGPYEQLVVPLDQQGLVFLCGENLAAGGTSNGAGKTMIFDVISEILLGETAKGERKDALTSWERPQRGSLRELDFAVNDDDFLVRKARKHPRYGTALQIFQNGTAITKKGMPAAERQLRDEILQLTLDEFYNCVAGSTLIPTHLGLIPIEQLLGCEGILVASRSRPAPIGRWLQSGTKPAPVLQVATAMGMTVTCSYRHRFLVLRGSEQQWCRADELRRGDQLCVSRQRMTRQRPLDLKLPDPAVKPYRNHPHGRLRLPAVRKVLRRPERMTPALARLLGYIVAEGSVSGRTEQPSRVHIINSDDLILDAAQRLFQQLFGTASSRHRIACCGEVRTIAGVRTTLTRDCFDLICTSTTLVEWLRYLGLYLGGAKRGHSASHHKVVPWSVLQSDAESQLAFLGAYIDGDGCITADGRIVLFSASTKLLEQVQCLLLTHGIASHCSHKYHRLTLDAVAATQLWHRGLHKYTFKRLLSSAGKSQRGEADTYYEIDGQLVTPVTSIRKCGRRRIFDLSMAPGAEPAYVANGLITHNTTYLTKNFTHLLITGKPAERDLYLTQLFGLRIYGDLGNLVSDDLKQIRKRLETTRDLEATRRALEKRLAELPTPPTSMRLHQLRAQVAALQARDRKLQQRHDRAVAAAQAQARRDSLREQLAKLRLPSPVPRAKRVQRKLHKAEYRLQQLRDAQLFQQQRAKLQVKLARLEKVAKLDDARLRRAMTKLETTHDRVLQQLPLARRRHELERSARKLRQRVAQPDQVAQQVEQARQNLAKTDARIDDLRTRLRVLQHAPHARCPTCGTRIKDKQQLVATLHQQCTTATKERHALVDEQQRLEAAAKYATRLHEVEQELKQLPEHSVDRLERRQHKLRTLMAKVQRALALIEQRTQLKEQLRGLPAADTEVDATALAKQNAQVAKLRQLLPDITSYEQLQTALAQLPTTTTDDDVATLARKLRRCHDQYYVARQQLDDQLRQLREWRTARRELRGLREQLDGLHTVRDMERALDGLMVAFGRKGLRLQRLRAIIKVIAAQLPFYLNLLFAEKGLRFEVAEQEDSFSLSAFKRKHPVSLEGFSRGEKARLTLALLLATRLATPTSKHTNALFLDEVFDAIDVYGYEGVFTTLRHVLAAGDITSIFLISQNSDAAKQYRKYIDQVWLAAKNEKGVSSLHLAGSHA